MKVVLKTAKNVILMVNAHYVINLYFITISYVRKNVHIKHMEMFLLLLVLTAQIIVLHVMVRNVWIVIAAIFLRNKIKFSIVYCQMSAFKVLYLILILINVREFRASETAKNALLVKKVLA